MNLVQNNTVVTPRDKFIALQEVCALCSVKKSTIYAWINDPSNNFPRPVHLSARMVRWPETAILTWIQSTKINAGSGDASVSRTDDDTKGLKTSKAKGNESAARDQFAMAALQGMLANPELKKEIMSRGQSWISASAWAWADDMMKSRAA